MWFYAAIYNQNGCGVHRVGSASLDRIDPQSGYLEGNVRWVHKAVNKMKWDIPHDIFLNFCQQVSKYTTQKNIQTISEESILIDRWGKNEGPFCKNWKGFKGITGNYWYSIAKGAKIRGLYFDLDIKEAWDLFIKQNGSCAYSGIPLKLKRSSRNNDWTASIDRINPNGSYELSNICWCHKTINLMKHELPKDQFIDWCIKVTNFC